MNSSTLNRSNLSKEKMTLLKEIKSQRNDAVESAPGVYVRPTKERELDVLWQTFKVNQKDEKSPAVYLVAGFIVGALAMFSLTALISFTANDDAPRSSKFELVKKTKVSKSKANKAAINFLPPDKPAQAEIPATTTETYTVKPGDTLDKIIVRFYGNYDPSKIELVTQANNMANPNALTIGQELTIPLN